jgi:hypothetical protein
MDDIVTALRHLSEAFRDRGLRPARLELTSWQDGKKLLAGLPRTMPFTVTVLKGASGEGYSECEVQGIKIRWPSTPDEAT